MLETVPETPQPERPHDPLGAALGKGGPVEAASRDLKDFSISGKTTTTASDDPGLKKPKLYRGTEGKPLNVSANYLRMEQVRSLKHSYTFFFYPLVIDPGIKSNRVVTWWQNREE